MKPPLIVTISADSPGLSYTLTSLREADIPVGVPLVLSISHAPVHLSELQSAAERAWSAGPVTVLMTSERPTFDTAESLAGEHGAVIVLSDNFVVSQQFYHYAQQALGAYSTDDQIASISLLALGNNARTGQPFIPLPDRGDTFFVRTDSPGGAVYTAAQIDAYRRWRETAPPPTDWPTFLEESRGFTVFPRSSLTTAVPVGKPYKSAWRRPPLNQFKRQFNLVPLAEAVAVYDSHFEMLPDRLNRLTDQFEGITFALDLYATRDLFRLAEPYVITSRRCEQPLRGFSKTMRPMEANLIARLPGDVLQLASTSAVDATVQAATTARRQNDAYFRRHQQTGGRQLVSLHAASWAQSILGPRDHAQGESDE